MPLPEYLALVKLAWAWLAAATLLSALLAWGTSSQLPAVYAAHATLRVSFSTDGLPLTYEDALLSQQALKTYVRMATQPAIIAEAARRLEPSTSPEDLAAAVIVEPVRDSQLFTITAEAGDPRRARAMANMLAQVFVEQEAQRLPPTQSHALSLIEPAPEPTRPARPRVLFNTAVVGLLGLIGTHMAMLLHYRVRRTVHTVYDIQRAAEIPILGTVGQAEEYEQVAARVGAAAWASSPQNVVVVSGLTPGSGTSTVVAHLALALARAHHRVLVVDANLRRPRMHELMALPNGCGLSDLATAGGNADETALDACLQPGPLPGLRVLAAGRRSVALANAVRSPVLLRVMDLLRTRADVVLVDAPALLGTADALWIAAAADANILVVHATRSRLDHVEAAVDMLKRCAGRSVSAVLYRPGLALLQPQRTVEPAGVTAADISRRLSWRGEAQGIERR